MVNNNTFSSDNSLWFRRNLLERKNIILIVDVKIRGEKGQYNVNKEAVNISILSSEKLDEYEFLKAKKYYLLIKVK